MPTEHKCDSCRNYSPRVHGDHVNPADPAVPAITMVCQAPAPIRIARRWRGNHIYTAPAEAAAFTRCPSCDNTIGQVPHTNPRAGTK